MAFNKKSFEDIYATMAADTRTRVPALSNFEEGSVVRSLLESFSVELALLYEQMDLVYQSAFVDTAAASDLDRVVAVLGVRRNEPDYATGEVTFTRDPGTNTELTIPIATLVTTEENPNQDPAKKAYSTTEVGRMDVGQNAVNVRVQAEVAGRDMTSDAGTVIVMPRPVPGVKSVTNSSPIRFLGRDRETDDELRDRAKQALLASGRASTTSIESALLGMPGVRDVHVTENFPTDATGPVAADKRLGQIEVYVDGLTSQNASAIRERIDQVRAAGIYVLLKPAVEVMLEAVIQIDVNPKVSNDERIKLENKVRTAILNLVDRLGMGRPLLFSQLASEVLKVSGVNDITRFEMFTYREAGAYAHGTVTLQRSAPLNAVLKVPPDTVIQTDTGQQFRLTQEAKFVENVAELPGIAVQALVPGRAGELWRTGAANYWNHLALGGADITVENVVPLILDRTNYRVADRMIPVDVQERLTPVSIRVASEMKPLAVRVEVRLKDRSGDRDAKRHAIENAVDAFFNSLAQKADRSFNTSDLANQINAAVPNPGPVDLHVIAFPFQSPAIQDDPHVEASFIEVPQVQLTFVYMNRVELAGQLRLVLSLTAQPAEKTVAIGATRQAIADYLDSLGPEQPVDLDAIGKTAQSVEKVLRIEFDAADCQLLDDAGTAIPDRVRGSSVTIQPFEKVFVSNKAFVIQA